MIKEELLELDGIVDEVLPDSRYRVTLRSGGATQRAAFRRR